MLLWGNGTVHQHIGEVCTKEDRGVRVASNNDPPYFEVVNDAKVEGAWGHTMVEYEESTGVSWFWEIEKSFHDNFHLSPTFYDNNFTWGWWDESEGRYTGALGMVRQFLTLFLSLYYITLSGTEK